MANILGFPSEARPSRRGPRRDDVVVYRVRVELAGTLEPLWRRLELASDLFLDDLHTVLQAAFGWTDSHLHRFASGPSYYSDRAEYYLMPFEIEEGEDGIPEHEVRLDEVLMRPGDSLFYCYDFGDDWHHVIRLEDVLPGTTARPRAICTGGRGAGPAEDCGGVDGYDLLVAATDPQHSRHAQARAHYARIFGADADPDAFAPTRFDQDAVTLELSRLGLDAPPVTHLPEPIAELLQAVRLAPARKHLRRLIGAARLDQEVSVDAVEAARMVRPYAWLLDRVGVDGIKLTAAGYLPPAHVQAAVTALGLDDEWIGKGNREIQTYPVLQLRESAQRAGLLRKHKGHLTITALGRALSGDPVALWSHLAQRTPPTTHDACRWQAGLLLLITIAAGVTDEVNNTVAELLDALGWIAAGGSSLFPADASYAAADTKAVLRLLGGFEADPAQRWRQRPSAAGVTFARAALQRA